MNTDTMTREEMIAALVRARIEREQLRRALETANAKCLAHLNELGVDRQALHDVSSFLWDALESSGPMTEIPGDYRIGDELLILDEDGVTWRSTTEAERSKYEEAMAATGFSLEQGLDLVRSVRSSEEPGR